MSAPLFKTVVKVNNRTRTSYVCADVGYMVLDIIESLTKQGIRQAIRPSKYAGKKGRSSITGLIIILHEVC